MHFRKIIAVLLVGVASLTVAPAIGVAQQNERPREPSRPESTLPVRPQQAVPNAVACFRGGQVLRCITCAPGWHCSGTGDGSCQPPSDTSCNQ